MKRNKVFKTFLHVGIFAIAMGFLEAIVVVYVRELYYPSGFHFPLKVLPEKIYLIEIVRELTTIIMLWMVALLSGKKFYERLAFFLYSFGIWDIVYYIALKVFLGWPAGLLTWDILFLIPVTWIGPVVAPVICAATMILFAVVLLLTPKKRRLTMMGLREWSLAVGGSLLIFVAFIRDFSLLLYQSGLLRHTRNLFQDPRFIQTVEHFVPRSFSWSLFLSGELLLLLAILSIGVRHRSR